MSLIIQVGLRQIVKPGFRLSAPVRGDSFSARELVGGVTFTATVLLLTPA